MRDLRARKAFQRSIIEKRLALIEALAMIGHRSNVDALDLPSQAEAFADIRARLDEQAQQMPDILALPNINERFDATARSLASLYAA
ncbi:MAG: hypothetical protein KDA20_00220 [Phycisphaerales bacterium]|nr:hypothetical protein [Phycisphaerales bacterium]